MMEVEKAYCHECDPSDPGLPFRARMRVRVGQTKVLWVVLQIRGYLLDRALSIVDKFEGLYIDKNGARGVGLKWR